MGTAKKGRIMTPLRAFKKSLGEEFASSLWERCAARWWDDYLDARADVNPRNRDQSEGLAAKIADKPYRNEWIYLLLTEGFFEGDDLEDDGATHAAVLHMRMFKRMAKTHEHALVETRRFGASYDDLPNPVSAHPEAAALKLGAVNCWGGAPGRFRPLRTSDARRHPGWMAAGRYAARFCFAPDSSCRTSARDSFDALRSFCVEMNEELAEAGESIGPLIYLLHQELAASPGVSDSYRSDFYETVLAGYLIAIVHGTAALYEYGLIQRHSGATVEGSLYDAGFEAGSTQTSRFVASVFLVDSTTLAPLSLVRTVELDPKMTYLAGRAPSLPEDADGGAARLLLLPGGDSVSRHAFTLRYDAGRSVWVAEGSGGSSRPWYSGGPEVASPASFSVCGSSDRVRLKAGSRIVLLRAATIPEGSISLPSVMVSFSYVYDQLDGGGWSRWAKAEEFLSVGARDIWLDAFDGRRRPLYVPEDASLLSRQWSKSGFGVRVPDAWPNYLDSAREFMREAAALSVGVRQDAAQELSDAYDAVRRMAKRIVKIVSDAPACDSSCLELREKCIVLQEEVDAARKRDEADARAASEARRLLDDPDSVAREYETIGAFVPSKQRIDSLLFARDREKDRVLALCRKCVTDLYEFRYEFELSNAGYSDLRSALDAASRASCSLRAVFAFWGSESSASLLDDFDAWVEGSAKAMVNAARRGRDVSE